MRITAVRLLRLTGTLETSGPFWEERLVRPIDIYPAQDLFEINRIDFIDRTDPELLF